MRERNVGGLRCSKVLALLSEYVDGELDESVVAKVENHLRGCPNCERFGRNFGSMVISLREESQPSPDAPLDVMARLFEQLREAEAEA
jgi:anti-sigma factor RsiW